MNIPENLKYTEDHEWIKVEDGKAKIGITDHAQNELGDIVFIELPDVGDEVSQGEDLCVVESVKSVSDIYAPISGEIVSVNDDLETSPERINKSPYQDGWVAELSLEDESETGELMDAGKYEEFIS